MARLVSGVIQTARDYHPAFDEQRNPKGGLYRYLANYCQEVQGKIMAIDPTYGGVEQTMVFSLPLLDFENGMALGPGRLASDVVLVNKDTEPKRKTTPITLIPREHRFTANAPYAAAWQEGENLYLRAPEENYTNYGSVEVQVVQNFTDDDVASLQNRAAIVPLPDAAASMVTDALALFMARRGHTDPNLPPINLADFIARAAASESAFYDAVTQRLTGRVYVTQDVMGWE